MLSYLLLGAIIGIIAGLLGVGGGLVIVPALFVLLPAQGIPSDLIMHVAVGTSLATIVLTSLSSIVAHQRHGAIVWLQFFRLLPGIMMGAWLGAVVVDHLPATSLKLVFGCFELVVGLYMLIGLTPKADNPLPNFVFSSLAGVIIGLISAVIGIGGGTLSVPYLTWHAMNIRKAIATSAALGLPIALSGTLSFIWVGHDVQEMPEWSSGYIFWPAFFGITVASMSTAPIGAWLAHHLPIKRLKQVFSFFLLLLGLRMITI